jgi:hypothetical protein
MIEYHCIWFLLALSYNLCNYSNAINVYEDWIIYCIRRADQPKYNPFIPYFSIILIAVFLKDSLLLSGRS